MTVTEQYQAFMEGIATQIPAINEVILSDGDGIDQFLVDSISKDVYPALCLVRPRYKHSDNGNYGYYSYFDVVLYVFCKTKVDDYATDNEKIRTDNDLNTAEAIITEFGLKLHQHNRLDTTSVPIDFNWNDWQAEPVSSIGVDDCKGYEAKFRLGLPSSAQLNHA